MHACNNASMLNKICYYLSADSYEYLMHNTGKKAFGLDFRHEAADLRGLLEGPRLERAIGVIYRPDTERWSHYFEA